VKIADLALMSFTTIPLQLQINFIELREDISGLWQPRYWSITSFDSHLLRAATSGVRRKCWWGGGYIQWRMMSFVFYVCCLWRHNWRRIPKPTFWRSLHWSSIADKIKTIVLDKVNYRGTQSQTCVVGERSAKSGELVSGCRQ